MPHFGKNYLAYWGWTANDERKNSQTPLCWFKLLFWSAENTPLLCGRLLVYLQHVCAMSKLLWEITTGEGYLTLIHTVLWRCEREEQEAKETMGGTSGSGSGGLRRGSEKFVKEPDSILWLKTSQWFVCKCVEEPLFVKSGCRKRE